MSLAAVDPRGGADDITLGRGPEGAPVVVLAFPYDAAKVSAARAIPGRRFDWDRREWWAPLDDWVGVHVADMLDRFPELTTSPQVDAWLTAIDRRWIGTITTTAREGRGWWLLRTRAGTMPPELLDGAVEAPQGLLSPMTRASAATIAGLGAARLDAAAQRCMAQLEHDLQPPGARLAIAERMDGQRLRVQALWDHEAERAFARLPAADDADGTLPLDPWLIEALDAYLDTHAVAISPRAAQELQALRVEHAAAAEAVARSRATEAEPIAAIVDVLGGKLEPFQWAAVRYALDARSTFLADEQGLGKTVEALAALEADGAFPAVIVCPASMKLTWEREAAHWLPHRSTAVVHGRTAVPPRGDLTILNYEIVAAHRDALARARPRALVVDESHLCKNPRAKRTQAVRRLARSVAADGLLLALSGTPVLNNAEELVSQLRVLGRIEEFGSGARFAQRFRGPLTEERLHWHLRRRCLVRRLKADVLPQLPAKRRVVVPVELGNREEYELAERDVIAWLRTQPLDLAELNAKIAATLRAQRLAQLGALQRLAARGKLAAALAWIEDFLAAGEPLVVFARHVEVQHAMLARFPAALHLLGSDDVQARERAIAEFQAGGAPLIVCATRVAAQGITLTRASNVAFLELEWTPALHDQAEDRCHRIGQRDAVTAWYLLAAETIDETMAELIERKRGHVAAVTDGRPIDGDGLVHGVVRVLRDGRPVRRLRAVG